MKINKNAIKSTFFYILCSFVFLKPSGIDTNGYHTLNSIINFIEILIILFLITKMYVFANNKLSKVILAEICFFAAWLFCFYINGSSIQGVLKIAINAIGFELLVEYSVRRKKLDYLIKCFVVMYIILLTINIILMVQNYGWTCGIFNSMYDSFSYLESDNGTNGYIVGALLFGLLYSRISKNNSCIPLYLLFGLCAINEYRIWSASSLVGMALFVLYFFLMQKFEKLRFSPLIATTIVYFGITFFRMQYLFSYIIINYLHRDVHMTGRTELWDRGIALFESSPFFGVGIVNFSLDNILVQILANGGMLLLSCFAIFLFVVFRNIRKPSLKNNIIYRDTYFVVCIIVILSIAEAWVNFKGFWIIMSMFANLCFIDPRFQRKSGSVGHIEY